MNFVNTLHTFVLGLLLYNGQNDLGGDFVSLGLIDGVPEFRFNLGSGTAILTGSKPLDLDKWHTIKIERNRRNGTMIINRNQVIHGMIGGKFQGLDLLTPLYIGGHPNIKNLPIDNIGVNKGFKGCISQLKTGPQVLEVSPNRIKAIGVKGCSTCSGGPDLCDNAGICQEANVPQGHRCICQPGFSGLRCQIEGVACFEGACGGRGKCADTPNGFECFCPFGKSGEFCQEDLSIKVPYFDEEAYLAIPEINHILYK
jgi:hypothetical protein